MTGKPQWCYDNCGGAHTGQGYAKDSGSVEDALAAFIAEAPGGEEVQRGEAMVGPTGRYFNGLLDLAGLPRHQVLIANTLRCRWGTNQYPKGSLRKECEAACRHWDISLDSFGGTVYIVTYHPASIFSTPQYEDYVIKALRLGRKMVDNGEKPVVLLGDKALAYFAPWLKGGVGSWKGHWFRT